MGRNVGLFHFGKLSEERFLFVGDLARNFDVDLNEQIARSSTAVIGHSATTDLKDMSRLCPGRDCQYMPTLEYGDLDLGPQRGLCEGDWYLTNQVGSFTAKQRMVENLDLHVEVATRPSQGTGFPFSSHAQPHAVVDAGGNPDV